ncbi:MAG: MarC family protein [Candidatus Omnitrophica bacterium]|nr:MarC family protein [Candidatus Omnitrophota bacterium]MDE2221814.1 MarC family protein [Candidatus Omnitrophota bacterium]
MFNELLLVFIPMFFTVDPIGILPVFVSLTQGLTPQEKRDIIFQSLVTASLVAVGFMLLGKAIFQFLGITMGDFMVAGGVILFCLGIVDLTTQGKTRHGAAAKELGAVPIGTPLIAGPAVLTISLMLTSVHGLPITILALFLNLAIVGVVFTFSANIMQLLGQAGSRALSKVMMLLLAAIGVMMVRRGIMDIVSTMHAF